MVFYQDQKLLMESVCYVHVAEKVEQRLLYLYKMIPKQNRIKKNEFDLVFKEGFVLNSPIFLFKFKKSLDNKGYFSFVVPKSIIKSAVKRNSLRRKGYNSLKNKVFPAIIGIFIYKKGVNSSITSNEISENIDFILSNIRIK